MTNEALKKIIELLEGLEDKRLAHTWLWDQDLGCGCLMGSICGDEVRKSVRCQALAYRDVVAEGMPVMFASPEAAAWAHSTGLTAEDAYQLQMENDAQSMLSPEARYTRMLEWLKNELRVKEECAAWNEKNGISHE
jgi:hypothetical protein